MIFQNKIDFQAHYLPKTYYDFLEEEGLKFPDVFSQIEYVYMPYNEHAELIPH